MTPVTWSVGLDFREGWHLTGPSQMNRSLPGEEMRWEGLPNTGNGGTSSPFSHLRPSTSYRNTIVSFIFRLIENLGDT